MEKCSCAYCEKDVLLRITVVCNACQGYCHKECTKSSTVGTNQEVFITCEGCTIVKGDKHPEMIGNYPMAPFPKPFPILAHNAATVLKTSKLNVYNQQSVSFRTQDRFSEMCINKETRSETVNQKKESFCYKAVRFCCRSERRTCNWGLIWKNKPDDLDLMGTNFRSKNVLLKGNPDESWLKPVCRSCRKEYNQELMYIHCEKCKNLFHADAVKLEESRVTSRLGFKCCKCCRIKPPPCPYGDEAEKSVVQPIRNRPVKYGNELVENGVRFSESRELKLRGSKNFYNHDPVSYMEESVPSKNAVVQRNGDPLLFSLSRVENIMENDLVEYDSGSMRLDPHKLPVRGQSKYQEDDVASEDKLTSTYTQWSVPANDPRGDTI